MQISARRWLATMLIGDAIERREFGSNERTSGDVHQIGVVARVPDDVAGELGGFRVVEDIAELVGGGSNDVADTLGQQGAHPDRDRRESVSLEVDSHVGCHLVRSGTRGGEEEIGYPREVAGLSGSGPLSSISELMSGMSGAASACGAVATSSGHAQATPINPSNRIVGDQLVALRILIAKMSVSPGRIPALG